MLEWWIILICCLLLVVSISLFVRKSFFVNRKEIPIYEAKIFDELRELRAVMVRKVNGEKKYRVVADFSKSHMAEIAKGIRWRSFRPFVPYKPTSNRMLNACYGGSFESELHTLMDYPTIVSGKLGGSWEKYNRLISLHVAGCPLHCWHCYVDECLVKACGRCVFERANQCKEYGRREEEGVTAEEVVDNFLEQRKFDEKIGDVIPANILRITGGEPFTRMSRYTC